MGDLECLTAVNFISGGASTCVRVIQEELPGGSLFNSTETVAIIANSHKIDGIQNVIDAGFPEDRIYVVEPGPVFAERLLVVLDRYNPDFFQQLGYMPQMPEEVIARYVGFNQHFGPGGKGMFGVRRVYVHMQFCRQVDRLMPIQVFCQLVDPVYDAGKIVFARMVDLDFSKTPEENAKILLPIEHEVQISGRRKMFYGLDPVETMDLPINIAQNPEEEALLLEIKKEAVKKYPRT